MGSIVENTTITVGVLALQASKILIRQSWTFLEVRTVAELNRCDALIIPGGESTAISLVAQRSNLLEPLREFVKVRRKPTWGTCAGLILLAESANRTKQGGQELIGGLDVRVNRNHFGRQTESFQATLDLPFLRESADEKGLGTSEVSFKAIFIRAPIVERLLCNVNGVQEGEARVEGTVVAPSRALAPGVDERLKGAPVEVLATLPQRASDLGGEEKGKLDVEAGDIVAVRQANVFGTSFHPELTGDPRIHVWWLGQVVKAIGCSTYPR